MSNAMIILLESVKLMEEGIIGCTGEKMTIEDQNGKREIDMPESIHTYQRWKSLGYQVKKGQKAKAQFPIWKYTSKKDKEMSEEEAQANGYCFLKTASFFTKEQVEKIKEAV